MITNSDKPAFVPVFKKCVRCGYSLRGLPANHICPECGLRFDERCALYRVANPRQLLAFWLLILGGGWVSVENLPHFANLASASAWKTVGALAGALWIVCVPVGVWFFVRRYRRGFDVAITSDGLILHLPGFSDDLIPWSDIGGASIKERPAAKPQIASVFIRSDNKSVEIGGWANVFPGRADVKRFVAEINERIGAPPSDEEGAVLLRSQRGRWGDFTENVMVEQEPPTTQQAGRIIDARGRNVSQLDPVMMHLLHRPGIIPSDALREIAQQVGLGITRATRSAFWASIAGLVCLGIALAICTTRIARGSISTATFFKSLIPYTAVLCGLFTCWISLRNARHQQIGNVMLQHLRCPHCGYDIRSLPTDRRDGATVCPECGCAWKLDDSAAAQQGGSDGRE